MSVLIGYVDTPEGRAALERGIAEAELRRLPVHIVRFAKVGAPGDAAASQRQSEHLENEQRRLAQLARQVGGSGLEVETHLILESRGEGQFVRDFKALADKVGATLAVIGIRNRSRVGKFVLGSRAQDALLHLDCDVLAVKATTAAVDGAAGGS